MVRKMIVTKTVKIPENVNVKVDEKRIVVEGPLGSIERDFSHAPVIIRKDDGQLIVEAFWPNKKTNAMIGTVSSLVNNMVVGVVNGFQYKLKIVFAHFPMSVKVQNRDILIENFHGERKPRKAMIRGNVKVSVEGDDITVQGIDKTDVSQTAADIQQATRIKKKDPRVFLDGIYVFEKKRGLS